MRNFRVCFPYCCAKETGAYASIFGWIDGNSDICMADADTCTLHLAGDSPLISAIGTRANWSADQEAVEDDVAYVCLRGPDCHCWRHLVIGRIRLLADSVLGDRARKTMRASLKRRTRYKQVYIFPLLELLQSSKILLYTSESVI